MISVLFLVIASTATAPTPADVQRLEVLRVIEPLASPTRTPGKRIVEFGPTIETRGLSCAGGEPRRFVCAFETRTKGFFDRDFGSWTQRKETLGRDRLGNWRFEP